MNIIADYENFSKLTLLSPTANELICCLDLTLLEETAEKAEIRELQNKARNHGVAAICILPQHLFFLEAASCTIASVCNFPTGNLPSERLLAELNGLLTNPLINEIDFVFPYKKYLNARENQALMLCQKVITLCQVNSIKIKIILETGAFSDPELLYKLARTLIDFGADFLKTSTGKIQTGATPLAAFVLAKAISDANSQTGIKLSGGIKNYTQAAHFAALVSKILKKKITPDWFRIGASSLLDNLLRIA